MINVTGRTAEAAYRAALAYLAGSKDFLTSQRASLVLASVSAKTVFDTYIHLIDVQPRIDQAVAVSGFAAYSAAQPQGDIATDWPGIKSAMQAAVDGMVNLFPVDANGFVSIVKLLSTGLQWRIATAAQVAPVVNLIDAILINLQ